MLVAPFKLSVAAEQYFRALLADTRAGEEEPALVWSPTLEVSDPETGERSTYEGPSVTLGWYKKGQRSPDSFFELCGFTVSIMSTTLEHLEGKTISREPVASGFSKGPRYWYVLKPG